MMRSTDRILTTHAGSLPRPESLLAALNQEPHSDGAGDCAAAANCIQHPEVVADRVAQFASVASRENVVASTDCGFRTFVGMSAVTPRVAYGNVASCAGSGCPDGFQAAVLTKFKDEESE